MIARRYQDLVCWQLANELKKRVYAFTAKAPAKNDFKFCGQIRDSARGAPRTMAEAFGRFRPPEFARYLEFARASLMETHNHLQDGRDSAYLGDDECSELCLLANRAIGASPNLHAYLKNCKEWPGSRTNPNPRTKKRTMNLEP